MAARRRAAVRCTDEAAIQGPKAEPFQQVALDGRFKTGHGVVGEKGLNFGSAVLGVEAEFLRWSRLSEQTFRFLK
jgi:hypothetical protein